MQADDIKALSDVRLGRALECLDTAQKVMDMRDSKNALILSDLKIRWN